MNKGEDATASCWFMGVSRYEINMGASRFTLMTPLSILGITKIRRRLEVEDLMEEFMAVLTLTVIRFIIPFGLILLVGTLIKRSRPALR